MKRPYRSVLAAWLIVPAVAVAAQQRATAPQRPAPVEAGNPVKAAPPVVRPSLAGTIVDQQTRKPLARAMVMAAGTDVGVMRVTTTDDLGRFGFASLPPGRYLVTAQKSAYIANSYGATAAGRPGRVVSVGGSARAAANLVLPLQRGGVITGTITDASGAPVADARVRVQSRRDVGDEIAVGADAGEPIGALSDDRGIYRVYNLPPGDYIVAVQPRRTIAGAVRMMADAAVEPPQTGGNRGAGPPPPGDGPTAGYEARYFGGTTSPKDATRITLGVGQERSGIDVQTPMVPLVRVEGVITGGPARGLQVTLRPRDHQVTGALLTALTVNASPQGQFSFASVPPGDYTIMARAQPSPDAGPAADARPRPQGSAVMWASADVHVATAIVANLALTMRPALSLSGRVQVEGFGTLPADLPIIRVGLRPTLATVQVPPIDTSAVDAATGRFVLSGIVPGRYRLFVQVPANNVTQVPDWLVESAIANGRDVLDLPIDVGAANPAGDILVTLSDDAQDIDGVVTDAAGHAARDCSVVIFPAERELRFPQSRRIAARVTGADGRFVFGLAAALPPGEYYVAAIGGDRPNEQTDPAYLETLIGSAVRVRLNPNDSKTIALRVK